VTDQLSNQKDLATEHLALSWPLILDQAKGLPSYDEIDRIVICGCGDSHHASVGLSMGFSELTPAICIPSNSMNASRYLLPQMREQADSTLVIGVSASGEVARTVEALEVAGHINAHTLAFTGNPSGSLAQTAGHAIVVEGPELPHGPGLISYLSSLLMGFALIHQMAPTSVGEAIDQALKRLTNEMEGWIQRRWKEGVRFAGGAQEGECVFLGSGPSLGSALFGAAKLLEASGEYAWGQDVEEWAHLEYFAAEPMMRTWLLSADGRAASRESEVRAAADALGRYWHEDHFDLLKVDYGEINEILAPLVLWAGPSGYASCRTEMLGEVPFRNFAGGRDRQEGGGASRIRSSERSIFSGYPE
jgi:glucosamine--fructose-6-phosphate aminotransferase (isomerizing)